MKIDRSLLIQRLYSFSQEASGVVIGKPGIGKSYALSQLSDLLWDQKIPNYTIKVDQTEGSDEAFSAELGITGDWVTALNNISNESQSKAVLIIDAFDAARDEDLRKAYLKLIKKALGGLNQEKWNVLVSVRTYDATKSPQLLKLFPSSQNGRHAVTCRFIEIVELNEEELASAFKVETALSNAYQRVTKELKTVLRVPFFLWLLESVIENTEVQEIENLTAIKSETELLNTFWKKKITQTESSYENEVFLKELCKLLVVNRTLYYSKDQFVAPSKLPIFKQLRSDDIINEVGINDRDISFSHNIFFDYAVGHLIVPEEAQQLITFITEDKSRPFFLRPSFVFHFTTLWYNHRETFWKVFSTLRANHDPNIILFQRFLTISVIANEFDNIEEISPLRNDLETIQWLLQSIRFLKRSLTARHLDLLNTLSKELDLIYLWDFAIIFKNLLEKTFGNLKSTDREWNLFGEISRNFFIYILKKRTDNLQNKYALDRLGASRGIEFVARTYATNPENSREILTRVLQMMSEPKFDIWYITCLTDNIKHFTSKDPDFVSVIYLKVFGHAENSDEQTNMGGTVTLNLISNRRQDFDSCYYRLTEYFPIFLDTSPSIAIKTGLKIASTYVIEEKLRFKIKEAKHRTVTVCGTEGKYLSDFSSMWHDMLVYHKPAQLIDKTISYFEGLINQGELKLLYDILPIYIQNAEVAYGWKRLIDLGNNHIDVFKEYLSSMAENPAILEGSDTVHEIGISLEKVSSTLDDAQLERIEKAILSLINGKGDRKEASERRANRLLNCIPRERLKKKKSLKLLDEYKKIANDPTFTTHTSVTPFTTEDWLEEEGVDMKDSSNREIYSLMEPLQNFNNKWLNNRPSKDQFADLVKIAEELFTKVKESGKYDEGLRFSALDETAKFCAIICRAFRDLSEDDYNFCKNVISLSLEYRSKYEGEENRSAARGYTPTPRIEAAGGLVDLFRFKGENEIFERIQTCIKDADPVVRFNTARNISAVWLERPVEFWDMILERFTNEKDSFTLGTLIYNIYRSDILETSEEAISKSIKILERHIDGQSAHDTFMSAYVLLVLYKLQQPRNTIAEEIIYTNLSKTEFATGVASKIFELTDPKYPNNNYSHEDTQKVLIKVLKTIVRSTLTSLKQYDIEGLKTSLSAGESLKVLDFVVQRIYFALEINERIANRHELHPTDENKRFFFDRVESIYEDIIDNSREIGNGIIIGHTAHYLIETLNGVLDYYPEKATSLLRIITEVTRLSKTTGYTFDSTAIEEVVSFTEKILADHKGLLKKEEHLNNLTDLLNMYVESGWTEALNLIWKLDEAFK